jgi:hypothetical protein
MASLYSFFRFRTCIRSATATTQELEWVFMLLDSGNWFEESYAVPQPSRNHPQKQSRDAEIDIGYIDAHLKLRPLNRVARMPHWNTSGLVEAPQFKR